MAQELTHEQINQITDILASGSKIEAIKMYRMFSGKDLKDSKDFIELLIPQLIQKDPVRFAKLAQQGKGCSFGLVACLALFAGVIILFLSCVRHG